MRLSNKRGAIGVEGAETSIMAGTRRKVDPHDGRTRCGWASKDSLQATYHDLEWGVPIPTDAGHLERMAMEIFQCGLSWRIVLQKRPAIRRAFGRFNLKQVATMTARDVSRLCEDATIIRNRRKIEATIHNAGIFLELAAEHGSYRRWFDALPAATDEHIASLIGMFRKTFRFMGPETTRCYLMGVGKIEPEHEPGCWQARGTRRGRNKGA